MRFLLVAGSPDSGELPAPSPTLKRVFLDAWDVPEGDVSLNRALTRDLLDLRARHAALVYDLGHIRPKEGAPTLADTLRCGSTLSTWWTSLLYERHPKVEPTLHDLYRLWTLERLLAEGGADYVETRGMDARCEAALRTLCRERGWGFEAADTRPAEGTSTLRRVYMALPAPLRALARFGHWLVTVKRRLPRTRPAPLPRGMERTGTVVTYFPNIDTSLAARGTLRSRYWESLHDALKEDAEVRAHGTAATGTTPSPAVRWLFVRFPSPQGSLSQCVAWCRRFQETGDSGVSFNHIEEFLGPVDMLRALTRWARLCVASLRVEGAARSHMRLPGSSLDAWPLLKEDWAESFRGWRCLERCLQLAGIENYVAEAGPQSWYVFPMENCPWERMVVHAVHERKAGPVYGAQHSTIRPTDFRYFDDPRTWTDPETRTFQPDRVLGNGAGARAQWAAAGVPEDRLGVVEALRYLYLADTLKTARDHTDSILVVTSFFADETRAHLELLCRCIREGVLDAKKVIVKPHPYLPVEEGLREFLGEGAKDIAISTRPLPQELALKPVVWASNSTTAALEAALMGLPVLVMRPAGDFDLCPMQDVPGLPRTSDVESVRGALAHLHPLDIPADYLCLGRELPRWRALLGLRTKD